MRTTQQEKLIDAEKDWKIETWRALCFQLPLKGFTTNIGNLDIFFPPWFVILVEMSPVRPGSPYNQGSNLSTAVHNLDMAEFLQYEVGSRTKGEYEWKHKKKKKSHWWKALSSTETWKKSLNSLNATVTWSTVIQRLHIVKLDMQSGMMTGRTVKSAQWHSSLHWGFFFPTRDAGK